MGLLPSWNHCLFLLTAFSLSCEISSFGVPNSPCRTVAARSNLGASFHKLQQPQRSESLLLGTRSKYPLQRQRQSVARAKESALFLGSDAQRFLQARSNDDDDDEAEDSSSSPVVSADVLVSETSAGLRRVSWISWWAQVVLTTVSAVILVFARNVLGNTREAQLNFVLAGSGIMVSFVSIFWTWGGGARLSRRLLRRPTSRIQAANMLRRAIRVGVSLNLAGMFLTLLGAEQTVGYLAIKVLTARPWNSMGGMMPMVATAEGLQPLDILVVQANTNSLLSHFSSLVALLYLTRFVLKLDPPSEEGKERKRK